MQRVLITGGNGFLGSNLVRFFLRKSYAVCVVSRKCNNLVDVMESIEFIEHASPGYTQFADQIRTFNPTVVIHCAWDGGNKYTDVNTIEQVSNISHGVELLTALINLPTNPVFVGIGSFSEFGHAEHAMDTTPCIPITLYGQTKNCFMSISRLICETNGLRWLWVRPCLIYGPRDVDTRVFPSTIHKLLKGQDIILDGCTRIVDYLHVDDFCNGVSILLDTSTTGNVNVCSGSGYPLRQLIEWLKTEIEGTSVITFNTSRDRTMVSTCSRGYPDMLRRTGWKPNINVHDGLRALVFNQRVRDIVIPDIDGLHSET
jgi:dTDP-6-deoxy-L-talose 4-dehydrogenase (NAD+)